MKKLFRAILLDALIAGLIWLWQAKGIDGARTFLVWFLWFIASMQVIFVLFAERKHLFYRSPVSVAYDLVSTLVLMGVLLWLGFVTLPIVLFIGWIMVCARLDDVKKPGVA